MASIGAKTKFWPENDPFLAIFIKENAQKFVSSCLSPFFNFFRSNLICSFRPINVKYVFNITRKKLFFVFLSRCQFLRFWKSAKFWPIFGKNFDEVCSAAVPKIENIYLHNVSTHYTYMCSRDPKRINLWGFHGLDGPLYNKSWAYNHMYQPSSS